jgi:hypothetical protein
MNPEAVDWIATDPPQGKVLEEFVAQLRGPWVWLYRSQGELMGHSIGQYSALLSPKRVRAGVSDLAGRFTSVAGDTASPSTTMKTAGRRSTSGIRATGVVVGIFPDDQSLIRLAGMLCIEQNDCHEGRADRWSGLSSPRRKLGARQNNRFDARRITCSISGSIGAPAAQRGAR